MCLSQINADDLHNRNVYEYFTMFAMKAFITVLNKCLCLLQAWTTGYQTQGVQCHRKYRILKGLLVIYRGLDKH